MKNHLLVPAMLLFSILLMGLPNGAIAQTTLPWQDTMTLGYNDSNGELRYIPYFDAEPPEAPPVGINISVDIRINNWTATTGLLHAEIEQYLYHHWYIAVGDPDVTESWDDENTRRGYYSMEWTTMPNGHAEGFFIISIDED